GLLRTCVRPSARKKQVVGPERLLPGAREQPSLQLQEFSTTSPFFPSNRFGEDTIPLICIAHGAPPQAQAPRREDFTKACGMCSLKEPRVSIARKGALGRRSCISLRRRYVS